MNVQKDFFERDTVLQIHAQTFNLNYNDTSNTCIYDEDLGGTHLLAEKN